MRHTFLLCFALLLTSCAAQLTLRKITPLPGGQALQMRSILANKTLFDFRLEEAFGKLAADRQRQQRQQQRVNQVVIFENGLLPKKVWYRVAILQLRGNDEATKVFMLHHARREAYALGADFLVTRGDAVKATKIGTSSEAVVIGNQVFSFSAPEYRPVFNAIAGKVALFDLGFRLKNRRIVFVKDDSNAQKAGLREGQMLVTLDGEFIGDNPHLIDEIYARKRVGSTLKVSYLEDGKKERIHYVLRPL